MADYGTDVSTFASTPRGPDLDPYMALISGPRVVAEACARRLMTPRGFFPEEPEYGLDVRAWLNGAIPRGGVEVYQSQVTAECEKDERVARASTTILSTRDRIRIRVRLELETGVTFSLVLAVGAVDAQLESLEPETDG